MLASSFSATWPKVRCFGFYVAHFGNYGATYGSLGAVIGLLTWIYLSSHALLFGAKLNAELEHQTAHVTTGGPERTLGARGAWAADHVAGRVTEPVQPTQPGALILMNRNVPAKAQRRGREGLTPIGGCRK